MGLLSVSFNMETYHVLHRERLKDMCLSGGN